MRKQLILLLLLLSSCAFGSAKNVILIGNPRSMTTVLERYFINRGDFDVYHEPICSYVWEMSTNHLALENMRNAESALRNIHFAKRDKPYFIKDFAYFLDNVALMDNLMRDDNVQIVFIVREPEQAIISHYKLAVKRDVGRGFGSTFEEMQYSKMLNMMQKMRSANRKIVVIDADELTINPKKVLQLVCKQLNITFNEKDMHWQSSENIWNESEKVWQQHVRQSTKIEKRGKSHKLSDIPSQDRDDISKLIQKNRKIYLQIKSFK